MNPWQDSTLASVLDGTVQRWPFKEAVVDGDVRLTWADLRAKRDGLAGELADLGVGDGTRVGLLLSESWEHIVLFHALLKVGAVVIPLNLVWESPEYEFAFDLADIEVVVASTSHLDRPVLEKLAPLGVHGPGEVSLPRLPKLRAVIVDDRDGLAGPWRLQSLIEQGSGERAAARSRQEAVLVFTSGSSARPKAVVIRQDGMLGCSQYYAERLGLDENDRFLNISPFYHVAGICCGILPCALTGATQYVFAGFQLDAMVTTAIAERCTATAAFDIVLVRLLREFEARGVESPFAKIALGGGALVHDDLEDSGVRIVLNYAMTEAGNFVAITDPERESERGRMSAGFPLPGIDVEVHDFETGAEVPAGTSGELWFRGWNRFVEYYQAPDATAQAIDADGWFHTGDHGFLDEAGRLYYRGRYSMMVKTGGENVSEIEVEGALVSEVPEIRAAVVVGAPDDQWGEIVVAFVEVDDPATFDGASVRTALKGRLAAYKIPRRFVVVETGGWPVTPTGKVVKNELRARAAEHVRSGAASTSDATSGPVQ